jgi:hypothetical protein
MSGESAQQDVQVSFGKDFVIIGADRVEVSADGKKVTAYAKDDVEAKAASGVTPAPRDGAILEGAVPPSRDGGGSFSADFNTVVLNGVTIVRAADGHLVISVPGGVVKQGAAPANDTAKAKIAPEIGDRMSDGSVYAGISPNTNKPMYTTPADAPLTYTFNQAQKYAARFGAHGHADWRVPTKSELNVLFQNRAAIGGFDISGPSPAAWYWSSSQGYYYGAWDQRFGDGHQYYTNEDIDSSLRCVR